MTRSTEDELREAQERLIQPGDVPVPRLYEYVVTPLRVLDGDTFEAMIDLGVDMHLHDHVRLLAVDTPEKTIPAQHERAMAAAAFTSEWLFSPPAGLGLWFWLRIDVFKPREKYGRILATVYRSGDTIDLASALIAAGHRK